MVAVPGTRWNTASGIDTSFGSETLSLGQVEDLAQTANLQNDSGAIAGGTVVLTAAQLVNGVRRITSGTDALTRPTAAAIVAFLPNCQVGSCFDFTLLNTSGASATLVAGSGVTVVGTSLLTITTAHNGWWRFVVTNATVGAEAVVFYSVSVAVL